MASMGLLLELGDVSSHTLLQLCIQLWPVTQQEQKLEPHKQRSQGDCLQARDKRGGQEYNRQQDSTVSEAVHACVRVLTMSVGLLHTSRGNSRAGQ